MMFGGGLKKWPPLSYDPHLARRCGTEGGGLEEEGEEEAIWRLFFS